VLRRLQRLRLLQRLPRLRAASLNLRLRLRSKELSAIGLQLSVVWNES